MHAVKELTQFLNEENFMRKAEVFSCADRDSNPGLGVGNA